MKSLTLFSIAILTLTMGCDDAPAQDNKYGNHQVSQATPVQYQNQNYGGNQDPAQQNGYASQSQNNGGDRISMHATIDKKTGRTTAYLPLPESWKFIQGAQTGQPSIKGPNGLTLISLGVQSYMYTNDYNSNQTLQSYGNQVMAPVGIEAVISQQIIPQFRNMGMTIQKQYDLPEIAATMARYASQLYGNDMNQTFLKVVGIEGIDRDGNPALLILQYSEMRSSSTINWYYSTEILKAQSNYFEQAKKQYIYGYSNMVFDQQTINSYNNEQAIEIANIQANSEIVVDGINARGKIDADARAYVQDLDKKSRAIHQQSNDSYQERFNNHLTGVNVVVSPHDGKEYEVESGSNTYWINNEGKYIKSDNPNFDPNKYEDYQGVWQQAPNKVYK